MQEFLAELQRALTNKMSASEVAQHVNYYREYIEVEMRKGRSEQEILEELGSPRLIAKSILQAATHKTGTGRSYDGRKATGTGGETETGSRGLGDILRSLPDWVKLLLIILIVIVVASLFISVLRFFLPILLPLIAIFIFVKWWNRNK